MFLFYMLQGVAYTNDEYKFENSQPVMVEHMAVKHDSFCRNYDIIGFTLEYYL